MPMGGLFCSWSLASIVTSPDQELTTELWGTNMPLCFLHRDPDPDSGGLDFRGVWCLSYHTSLQHTVEEIIGTADRILKIETRVAHSRLPYMTEYQATREQAQQELYYAGVEGIGGLWGGDPNDLGPSPRYMQLREFAIEAKQIGAVVFMAVHGSVGGDGTLQQYFDANDVIYTGVYTECSNAWLSLLQSLKTPSATGSSQQPGLFGVNF